MSLSINLVPGETHYVVDHYGDMGFKAIFRGLVEDENGWDDKSLLLFERLDGRKSGALRFAACVPKISVCLDHKTGNTLANLTLTASYYGPTIRGLKSVIGLPKPPRWMKVT